MKRMGLSVEALKKHCSLRVPSASRTDADVLLAPSSYGLSRRQAIGLAGAATLFAAPLARSIESAVSASYRMSRRGNRIAFSVAGVERWIIDTRAFDGQPELTSSVVDNVTHIALRNALYPGTSISSDFTAEIHDGATASMHCKLGATKTSFYVPFVAWLLDKASEKRPTTAPVTLNANAFHVVIPTRTDVCFRPSWTLAFTSAQTQAPSLCTAQVDALTLSGSSIVVHLSKPDALSALRPAAMHSTFLCVRRGTDATWNTPIRILGDTALTMHVRDTAFDTCTLETASDGRVAGILEGASEGGITFKATNHDASFEVRDVRYAWTRTDEGLHEAFVARYATSPTWINASGVGMLIGEREGIPPLEIVSKNGEIQRFIVAPGLHKYHIPVDGGLTEPTKMGEGAQLAWLVSNVAPSALPKPHFTMMGLQIDGLQNAKIQSSQIEGAFQKGVKKDVKIKKSLGKWALGTVKFAGNPKVTVIRPDDLLVLTFEFVNIAINKGAGTFSPSGSGSKLIVHFQPQHIAERAFYYVNDPDKVSPNEAPSSAPKTGPNEPLLDPPIDAVMANDSRLVFSVPSGHPGKFTIEGLLDWSKFTQSVSPSAKPPDVEYTLNILSTAFLGKYLDYSGENPDAKPSNMTMKVKGVQGGARIAKTSMNAGLVANLTTARKGGGRTRSTGGTVGGMTTGVAALQTRAESSPDFTVVFDKGVAAGYLELINQNPPIRAPHDDETAIEYPYRLILSPNKYAGWAHSNVPIVNPANKRAELWHTRLGVKHSDGTVNEEAAYFRTMRAIWSPDVDTDYLMSAKFKERPFRTSLNRRDRHEIVQLTSKYDMIGTDDKPVDVRRFMMTSLGAWADMIGAWDPDGADKLDVEQWIQRGTQGRDHFVRVCYKGFLFPFGNRATLVKESERKFRRTPRGDMAAYLMQRMYIILRQPVREFPADGLTGMEFKGRGTPFRKVLITTRTTPNLKIPVALPGMSSNSFWPIFVPAGGDQDVKWQCVGTDWDNNELGFSMPMAFIANTDATSVNCQNWINNLYKNENARRKVDMGGQHLAYAPSTKKGDTALPTDSMQWLGYYAETGDTKTPHFFPKMERSAVRVEKVQELIGTDSSRDIEFFSKYLEHAFAKGPDFPKGTVPNLNDVKNPSQIFAKLVSSISMNFGAASDKAGGLAAPSIDVSGLSRLLGTVPGNLNDIANTATAIGNFDPMQYFADLLNAKILGDITLKDVLDFVMGVMNNLDKMPGLDKKDDFGIKGDVESIKSNADALKGQAQALANDVASEVKDARDALVAEVDKVKNEIQGYINDGKQIVEDRINEWKKAIENKANELKNEVDKALKPLIDAGNEAASKYQAVASELEKLKKGLSLVYEWQTDIKNSPGNILVARYPGTTDKDKKAVLYLKASIVKKLNLDPPEVTLYGSLSNFVINLIGDGAAQFLIIKFKRLAVSSTIGSKTDVDPDIEAVEFAGPLTFVNKLKDLIPSGGSAGGVGFSFDLQVLPSGITAELTIGLPNVTVGVFSLQNMAFIMRLTIPFDGRPFSAYFAFCTRENPFRLTVMVFAGGGFFGIEINPSGVVMLEAAFEFGGNFAFDIGIASGGASVMAGVYYKLETKTIDGKDVKQSTLEAYFRLSGNLSILGLIHVNLTFELKLTWQDNGKLWGTATIEVEIEVLFFSFSVGVTVERQLKGSDSDPTFKDMLPVPAMWTEYCNSFA